MVYKSFYLKLRKLEKIVMSYLAAETLVYNLIFKLKYNLPILQLAFIILISAVFM